MVEKDYTDEELIKEITIAIEELGGSLEEVDSSENIFRLVIDPMLQQQAYLVVNDITNKYKQKRLQLLLDNPLLRAKHIRDEIYG